MKHETVINVYSQNVAPRLFDEFMEYYLNLTEESTQKAFSEFFDMLHLKNGYKVLEVGFWTGRNLAFYPDHIHLKGIDITPKMIEIAKGKADELKRNNAEYAVFDGHNIPFDDNQFDVVLETFALCGAEKPQKLLDEMVRVCTPEGLVGLFDYRRANEGSRIRKEQDVLAETVKRQGICYKGHVVAVFDMQLELDKRVKESVEKYNLRIIDQLTTENSLIDCLGRYVLQK